MPPDGARWLACWPMSAPVPSLSSVPVLSQTLERVRYSAGALMVDLGGQIDTNRGLAPHQSRALPETDRADVARIFLLGEPVDARGAAEALAPATVAELVEANWLVREGDMVRCPVRITPHDGVMLVHDPVEMGRPDADVVLGRSSAANTLAMLTPGEHVGTALDVGTGCGIQALTVAAHADRVVAVDVSQRALDLTALGAALSGIDNIELRQGSWFEPVRGQEFDLIVSNPPFVISPESDLVYRDGSGGRDEVSQHVVTEAAKHLAPGGIAQILINWVEDPFASWIAPLQRWLEGAEVDALALHHLSEQPLGYAAKWNMNLHGDPQEHGRVLDQWTAHFEAEGILTIATGAIIVRRTGEHPPLFTGLSMESAPNGRAGMHTVRLLDAARWLDGVSNDELLKTELALVDDHRLVSERAHFRGEYGEDEVRITLTDSAGVNGELAPAAAAVLVGLEGGSTPADAIPGLAAAIPELHAADAAELVANTVRDLVSRGLLVRR